jgi:tRNA-specific 2-thiouridylase
MNGQTAKRVEVIVAMSGGVDSSVSTLLLQAQGRPLAGMFMKNWEEDDRLGACPAEADAADAQAVADLLGIDLHRRNFAAEYWDHVFEDFLTEYRAGRTPNPDILCNREIKFKTFLEHAIDLGADCIATGHYVRSDCRDGIYRLLRGLDHNKDQSYFLYKKDSTGICFIGERDFRSFLAEYIPPAPGEIRTPDGQRIGEHSGLMYYTLGQRQGLGIGGRQGFSDEPWYVLHKDMRDNILYVGQGHDHPWLSSRRLQARQLSWVSGSAPAAGRRLTAKVRYRQADQECTVTTCRDAELLLEFEQPQRAVTAGQSVVLYEGDSCLGGGIIDWADTPPAQQALRPASEGVA